MLTIFLMALQWFCASSYGQQPFSALKPPSGVHIALFEFADLQCPMCARVNPILKDAVAKYHISWVRRDLPLPQHNWSFQAAVNARWLDTQTKHLGDDYRDTVFANQQSIENQGELGAFTSKYAQQHGVQLPFSLDPQGKLASEIKADVALAQSLGVHQTPTVWVVTDRTGGAPPYTQVTDFSKLYTLLDETLARTVRARQ